MTTVTLIRVIRAGWVGSGPEAILLGVGPSLTHKIWLTRRTDRCRSNNTRVTSYVQEQQAAIAGLYYK